jgi:hypothetical protein
MAVESLGGRCHSVAVGGPKIYSSRDMKTVTHLLAISRTADPGDRAVYGDSLRLLDCWVIGFESRRGHGYMSLVSVVCCQIRDRSDHSSRGVLPSVMCLECDREASMMRRSLCHGGKLVRQ